MIIAIDGTAASGKGTLAKGLAGHLCLPHLDTGSLYRRVGLAVLRMGGDPEDPVAAAKAARDIDLTGADENALRSDVAGQAASKVAAIGPVRTALLDFQRRFAAQPGGAVLDGRDIGTVVCPGAEAKFFIDAKIEERARRRCAELAQRGIPQPYETILAEMAARDARDSERAVAPLTQAEDAILLMTDGLTPQEVLARAIAALQAS